MTDATRLHDAVAALLEHPDTVMGWSRRDVRAAAWQSAEALEAVLDAAGRGVMTRAVTEPLSTLCDGAIARVAHPTVGMLHYEQAAATRGPRDVVRELRLIEKHIWAQDEVTVEERAEPPAPYPPLGHRNLTPKIKLWLKHLWWQDWTRAQIGWPGRLAVLLFLLQRPLPVSSAFVTEAVRALRASEYFSIIALLIRSRAISLGVRARWLAAPETDAGARMLGVRAHLFARSGPLAWSRRVATALWPVLQAPPPGGGPDFFLDGPGVYWRGRRSVLPMLTESALQGARLQCLMCGLARREEATVLEVLGRPVGITTEFSAPGRWPMLTKLQWLERLAASAPPLVRRLALVELMTRNGVPGHIREAHMLRAARTRVNGAF